MVKQLVEKTVEFNKPAFMCFIDLTKAYNRIRLKDVTRAFKKENISKDIYIIEVLNTNTIMYILMNNSLSEEISNATGRQRNSFSPFLFNSHYYK